MSANAVTKGHRKQHYSLYHVSLPISGLQYYLFCNFIDCLWPWEVLQF